MNRLVTNRQRLREFASGNHGIFTAADAEDLDVAPPILTRLVQAGYLERVGFGSYRHAEVARDEYTQLAARLAIAGRDTYLADETVLALHRLALVDPAVIHLVTTRRNRRMMPPDTRLRREPNLRAEDVTKYHGLASLTVAAAIANCLPRLVPERTLAAIRDALRRDLIDTREAQRLRAAVRRQRQKVATQ